MNDSTIASPEFSLEEWMNTPLEDINQIEESFHQIQAFNKLEGIQELEEVETEETEETDFSEQEELFDSKTVTLKSRRIQGNLYFKWRNYQESSRQGGQVYTNVPCVTHIQECYPDVAYLTPELIDHFGEPDVFPRSFPLVAEIVSLTDLAEEVIVKAQNYLYSGSEEVWLVFPENRWIIVMTPSQKVVFSEGDIAYTQRVLRGFKVAVNELFV
ncbi:MAG: Uma2 family endonuclease [Cyanobacteria bacterium P01_A01_bin.45]